eukprot:EG_transcript_21845
MVDKHSHIELYEPKCDGDWADFSIAVAAQINRLKFGESTMEAVEFLSLFLHKACAHLDSDDLQQLNNGVVALVNEALLAQRKEQGKKTNKNKKLAQCNLDGDDDDYYYQDEYQGGRAAEPAPPPQEEPSEAQPAAPVAEEIDAEEFFRQKAAKAKAAAKPGGKKGKKDDKADQKALQALLAAKLGAKPKPQAAGPSQEEKERKEKEELKRRMLAAQQNVEEEDEDEAAPQAVTESLNTKLKKKVTF